jgi:MATE family multidrug resistance protein
MMSESTLNTASTPALHTPTQGELVWHLIKLSCPIITTMISQTVMQFVDFAMVSRLGTDAMAAVMPAGILVFCFISFGLGVLAMVSSLVSQSLGRKRLSDCSAYAWQGIYAAVIMGLATMPFAWMMSPFFDWVGHEPLVAQMEATYASIGILGIAPALLAVVLSNFFNGIHKPTIGMIAAIAGNIANIFLNWVLIFGHMGFEPMGIAGAAWGTNIAAVTQVLIMAVWFVMPQRNHTYHTLKTWKWDWSKFKRLMWFGLPSGFQHVADIFAFSAFTIFLIGRQIDADGNLTFDPAQQAAHNMAIRYLHLGFMPTLGLGIALASIVGKCIGEENLPLAKRNARLASQIALVYMGFVGAGFFLFAKPMATAFTDDPTVISWAVKLIMLCAVFQLFDALSITFSFALRGAGDTHGPAVIMGLYAAVFLIGGGYWSTILFPDAGAVAPWIAASFYICMLGLTFFLRWKMGGWEKIDMTGHESVPEAEHETDLQPEREAVLAE